MRQKREMNFSPFHSPLSDLTQNRALAPGLNQLVQNHVPGWKRLLAQSSMGQQKRILVSFRRNRRAESPQEALYHRLLSRGNLPWYSHGSDSLAGRIASSVIPTTKFWFRPTFTNTLRSTPLSSQ